VDTYIMPPIANATTLSFGLDVGGTVLDVDHPDLQDVRSVLEVLPFSGGEALSLPAQGNVDGEVTAIVTQHAQDAIEDGHEVAFQTDGAKYQYRCFLESWLEGVPVVPSPAGEWDDCP
ncbi:MAG: hypothetical protein KDA28_16405, partial [Phycisphaerales bacterium]|nr:hypothetical protein [Phycisphaerales bacterium]